jgi:hypothetical protein
MRFRDTGCYSHAPPPLWSLRRRSPALTLFSLRVQTVSESVAEAINVDGSLRPFLGPTGASPRTVCTPATSPTGQPPSSTTSLAECRRPPPPLLCHREQGLPVSHRSQPTSPTAGAEIRPATVVATLGADPPLPPRGSCQCRFCCGPRAVAGYVGCTLCCASGPR